ncbi:MAG: hypothetical protein KDC98_21080 [Planctomycetes bacterium]|nr:hypothetical protein [Planctomycetota bacterium]
MPLPPANAIIAAILVFVLGLRLLAGALDGRRIRHYLTRRGARLTGKRWTPFGKGWFGGGSERIYAIEYEDRAGCRHAATVKTSMITGVFLTEDRVVEVATSGAVPGSELERLRAENERLRAENERLAAEAGGRSAPTAARTGE